MLELIRQAEKLQAFMEKQGWKFCFIGGLALQRWGEPRFTRDLDLTLLTGFGSEETFIDVLLAQYPSRIPDARRFAVENRILLLQSHEDGIPMDISLGGIPFEERAVHRASLHEYSPGISLRTCHADDLIVMKAFANRDIDWNDVRGVIIRQQGQLDWDEIFKQLAPLVELKQEPRILGRLQELQKKF